MRRTALFALPIVLALALAGCGKDTTSSSASKSSGSNSTTTVASAASSSSGGATVVAKLTSSPFGEILTDAQGNTLYVFAKDTGTTSNCNSGCSETWPPMPVTGTPAGGTGINASDLGTTTRAGGTKQLTFFGHPVYHYAADNQAGDTMGQGIGGIWYVVNKSGSPVKSASASTATTMAPPTTKASSSGY
jgi:predicted lipoprotein with Yx(FWY)xxD motif